MKSTFAQSVYASQNSISDKVASLTTTADTQDSTLLGQLNQISTAFHNSPPLGNMSGFLTQVKSLLDATVIDPAMTRYVQPLQRLYQSMMSPGTATSPGTS
jgi:hypothetical protein